MWGSRCNLCFSADFDLLCHCDTDCGHLRHIYRGRSLADDCSVSTVVMCACYSVLITVRWFQRYAGTCIADTAGREAWYVWLYITYWPQLVVGCCNARLYIVVSFLPLNSQLCADDTPLFFSLCRLTFTQTPLHFKTLYNTSLAVNFLCLRHR